jgi:hypothetical protein
MQWEVKTKAAGERRGPGGRGESRRFGLACRADLF